MNPNITDSLLPVESFEPHGRASFSDKKTGGGATSYINSFWSDIFEVINTYSLNGVDCLVTQWHPKFFRHTITIIKKVYTALFSSQLIRCFSSIPHLEDSLHIKMRDFNDASDYSGTDLSATIGYSRTPFSLRSALRPDIYCDICLVVFLYRTRDPYGYAHAALFESSRFRIASSTFQLSAVVSDLAYCRISATSTLR